MKKNVPFRNRLIPFLFRKIVAPIIVIICVVSIFLLLASWGDSVNPQKSDTNFVFITVLILLIVIRILWKPFMESFKSSFWEEKGSRM